MKKYFIGLIAVNILLTGSLIFAGRILAQETNETANIQYPIQELGNCKDKADCKSYCDNSENLDACLVFAEKNNLMSEEEIKTAEKFMEAGSEGPGGCETKDACETYCNDMSHIDECISYAEKNNLIPQAELEEAKKVQAAIARGATPPPCGNKKSCDVYCDDPNHMEECITFGEAAGFIQGKELEDAKKMLQAIKKGSTPLPCHGKEACDEYCNNPDNMEKCITFAMEAGFMSEEEKADSQKMLQALKKGVKPPNCKGKEECDSYCTQEEHFEECLNFSEAAGFMTQEEAAMARKTGGKGPGGCKDKDECEAFCNNPDNQETCFNFAKENGLISEQDLKQIEEGKTQMKNALENAPPETIDCLISLFGADTVEKLKTGTSMPSKEIGDKMGECFSKSPNEGVPFGPGGCKGQEECAAYCQSHPEECQNMQQEQQAGPGGCKTQEECAAFCEDPAHAPECQNIKGPEPQNQGPKQTGPGGCTSPEECEAYCSTHRQECGAPQENQNQNLPCEGENCQYISTPTMPEQPQQQQQPGGQFQQMNPAPCEGGNCQYIAPEQPQQQQPGSQEFQQNQQFQPGQEPSTLQQTFPMPQNSPMEQTPPMPPTIQQEPPAIQPPPENPPPSSLLSPESLMGSVVEIFNKLFRPEETNY